jgi:hypothetical protein
MPCRYKLACVINLFPSFSLCHQSFSKFYCHSEKICSTSQIWRGLSLLSKQIQQLCMVWKILSITSLFPDEMHVDTRICKQTRIYYYQHSRSLACYLLIFITKDYQNTSFLWRTIRIWCIGRHDRENEETLTAILITSCLRFGVLSQ